MTTPSSHSQRSASAPPANGRSRLRPRSRRPSCDLRRVPARVGAARSPDAGRADRPAGACRRSGCGPAGAAECAPTRCRARGSSRPRSASWSGTCGLQDLQRLHVVDVSGGVSPTARTISGCGRGRAVVPRDQVLSCRWARPSPSRRCGWRRAGLARSTTTDSRSRCPRKPGPGAERASLNAGAAPCACTRTVAAASSAPQLQSHCQSRLPPWRTL